MHLVRTDGWVYSTGPVYSPQLHMCLRGAALWDPLFWETQSWRLPFVSLDVVQKLIIISIGDKMFPPCLLFLQRRLPARWDFFVKSLSRDLKETDV